MELMKCPPEGPTHIACLDCGAVRLFQVTPADFGLDPVSMRELRGGDASDNAEIIREVFAGKKGGPRIAVLINAAAGLCVAGRYSVLTEAVQCAADAIDSGAATKQLDRWVEFMQAP